MKQHTPEQIIAILREAETGAETKAEFCRRKGISEQTLARWRHKYGGLEVAEAKRLKALELENARLKKLLAEVMLANEGIKEFLAKKG